MSRYFIIHKPYHVLSQFSSHEGKKTLADYFDVPRDVYPVGRLDYDSEGLLILTNDTQLNHQLLSPQHKHEREYWVQVDGLITQHVITQLQNGLDISIDGKPYNTLPCKAAIISHEPAVELRNPPVRYRQHIPTSWLRLILTEGKNRQVRRMTAKTGYPTLRLIRYSIERLTLANLKAGEIKELPKEIIYKSLFR